MIRIWRYKLFQSMIFIFIALSLGIITSRLETLQFLFKNGNLGIGNDVVNSLIKDIKIIRIVAIILWGLVLGLYSNFIYSINKSINGKTNL